MSFPKNIIAPFVFLAILLAGCVSTSEHMEMKMEAEKYREEASQCTGRLEDAEERLDKVIETSANLSQQSGEFKAQRDDFAERLKECEFAIREREDEFRDEELEALARKREFETRQDELMPLIEKAERERALADASELMASDLRAVLSSYVKDGSVKVEVSGTMALVTFGNSLLYEPSSAVLTSSGKAILRRAAESLTRLGVSSLAVDSYTDSIPPGRSMKDSYPSNWELSAARAAAVADYITDAGGIEHALVVASGHSSNSPVADNSTREGRAANRRLVLGVAPLVPEADAPDGSASPAVTIGKGGL